MRLSIIGKVEDLVEKEYEFNYFEDYDVGEVPNEVRDSFGTLDIRWRCEPEDAIWHRDMQDNFYTGLKLGIRNAIKVLKDNPELLKEDY